MSRRLEDLEKKVESLLEKKLCLNTQRKSSIGFNIKKTEPDDVNMELMEVIDEIKRYRI